MSNLIHINHENFESEMMGSNPKIVNYWSKWCMPCKMMGPVFEQLSSEYEGKLKFAKLDTEAHPELAGQFGIRGIPSLLVLKDGKEVDRIVGFAPAEVLKMKIDEILEKI